MISVPQLDTLTSMVPNYDLCSTAWHFITSMGPNYYSVPQLDTLTSMVPNYNYVLQLDTLTRMAPNYVPQFDTLTSMTPNYDFCSTAWHVNKYGP
jgi:hypothetical protein